MHALLSTRRKTETRIGKPVRPGGEEEGGRSWKDTAQLSEERKGRTEGKPLKPTKSLYFPLQDGHCRSSASLLGKENMRTTEGYSQGRRDTGWLCLPARFPVSTAVGGNRAGLCLCPLPREAWEAFWLFTGGVVETPGEESPPSPALPPQPAPQPPRQHLTRFPVACFPARSTG